MDATVTAIYEDGVLRLLTPLNLPAGTQVRLRVEPLTDMVSPDDHERRFREALSGPDFRQPSSTTSQSKSLSAEERSGLDRRLAAGRPLSDLILEDRDAR